MFLPIISDLIKIRIRSNFLSKYLTIYLLGASFFFIYKSLILIYALNGLMFSIVGALIFPLTLLFYPTILIFSENYLSLFYYQFIFFFVPLIIRLITRTSKRRYY